MLIRVQGRQMRVRPLERFPDGDGWYVPVDVRDLESTYESQAIVPEGTEPLIADSQVRDAIRSVYLSATVPAGRRVAEGAHLPDDFNVEVIDPH